VTGDVMDIRKSSRSFGGSPTCLLYLRPGRLAGKGFRGRNMTGKRNDAQYQDGIHNPPYK
jgi:hypothetical protein